MENFNSANLIENAFWGFGLFRLLLNQQGEPTDFVLLKTNKSCQRILQLGMAEYLNLPFSQVVLELPELRDWMDHLLEFVSDGAQSVHDYFFPNRKQGLRMQIVRESENTYIVTFIEVNGQVFNDMPESRIEQIIGRDKDQSDYEEMIKNERKMFRTIIDLIPDAIYVKDLEGRKILANPAEVKLCGKSTENEVLGKRDDEIYPIDIAANASLEENIVMIDGESLLNIESHSILETGELVWRLGSKVPVKDHQGKIIGLVGVTRDISDQKNSNLALRSSEHFLSQVLSSLPVGVVILDPATHLIESANDYVLSLLGYDSDKLIGMDVHALQAPGEELLCEICKENDYHFSGERSYIRMDGTIIPVINTVRKINVHGRTKILSCFIDVSKRKIAESKLVESETNFRTFFETITDMIFIGNLQGDVLFTNSAFREKIGYAYEELSLLNLTELHQFNNSEEFSSMFADILEGRRNDCPCPYKRKDGKLIPVDTRLWRGKWNGEEVIFGLSKDLTQEQELLLRFNKMFDNNPAIMSMSVLPDGVFSDVNSAFLLKSGYSKEEVIGRTPEELGIAIDPVDKAQILEDVIRSGRLLNYELSIQNKSGEFITGLLSGEVIESQGVTYLLTVMLDISENKRMDADLKALGSFNAMLTKISETLILAGSDKLNLEIKKSLKKIGKFLKSERICVLEMGNSVTRIKCPVEWRESDIPSLRKYWENDHSEFPSRWKERFMTNEIVYFNLNDDLNPDSHEEVRFIKQVKARSFLLVPMYNGIDLIGAIYFDTVTARSKWSESSINLLKVYANIIAGLFSKRKNEELILNSKREADIANKAKSEFVANMSHEIRTPLNGVIGFADLLLKTPLNAIQKQYAENIGSSGQSLLGIINDILDFSKIEAGKMELEFIKSDIIELIEQSADIIKYHASKKNLELLLNIQLDLPRFALVDPLRLRQILVNLLSNAVKFTETGEVELKVTYRSLNVSAGYLTFSVRDTGIGISPEQQQGLFRAFSQADTSTTRRFGGSGLGLTISNMLAQKMGSKVELESSPGRGSTFYFTLETEVYYGPKQEMGEMPPIKRAMVIDDNENNRIILEHTFKNWGVKFVGFDNGLSALRMLEKSEPFDVIIVDYHMPSLNGIETVRLIRDKLNLNAQNQPIILLHSSAEDLSLYEECKNLGIRFNLTKPVKSQELFHYLRHLKSGPVGIGNEVGGSQKDKTQRELYSKAEFKILVAEDVEMNLLLVKTYLLQMLPKAQIIEAPNGRVAAELTISYHPDLVLMDVQMPEMGGIEATQKIRLYEKGNGLHTPIVALTAGIVKGEKENCLESGMDDFLSKPIDVEALALTLRKYLHIDINLDRKKNKRNIKNIKMQPFDRERFLENIGHDSNLLKELLEMMPEQFVTDFGTMREALRMGDMTRIRKIAHSMKGASMTLCFFRLADMALSLETSTDDLDAAKVSNLIDSMEKEYAEVLAEIKKLSINYM